MHAVVNKQCVDFTAGENIKNIYKVIGVWTMIGLKLKSNQFLLVVSAITQEDKYCTRMSTIPVKDARKIDSVPLFIVFIVELI